MEKRLYTYRFNKFLLVEENNTLNKESLRYYSSNLDSLYSYIEKVMRAKELPLCDIDVILSDLYVSLIKSRDYGEVSSDYNYTLESFVKRNISFCIDRYIDRTFNNTNITIDNTSKEDYYLIESIEDIKSCRDLDFTLDDLVSSLKRLEYKRYKFGYDIYNLLFIGIFNYIKNKKFNSNFFDIINCNNINNLYKLALKDDDFRDCVSAIIKYGADFYCLKELKNFMYSYGNLVKLLNTS